MIDHPILYSDEDTSTDWRKLLKQSNSSDAFWRKKARRKMRRIVRQLLDGIRPNIHLGIEYR